MKHKNFLTVMLFLVPLSGQAGSFDIGTFPADLASPGLNLVVDSTLDLGDANPGDGICATATATCTLRAAIEETNVYEEGLDSIILPAGTYVIASSLSVEDDLGVFGEDRDTTIIDATAADSAFSSPGANVTIDSVTIQGSALAGIDIRGGVFTVASSRVRGSSGNGIRCQGGGTARILNSEVLENSLEGVRLLGCSSQIIGSSISHNQGRGIAIFETFQASATLENSYVAENLGGGLLASGMVGFELRSTTVTNNTAANGAGFASIGSAYLISVNSTFSGNRATGHGGGIYIWNYESGGQGWVTNTTIAENVADSDADGVGDGGGIFLEDDPLDNYFSINGTLLAKNEDLSGEAPDCGGPGALFSEGFNLIGDTTGCSIVGDTSTNITDVDPKLGPLADNGGLTPTHRPLVQSPAINVIPSDDCTVEVDQRGVLRPQGPGCDIGSVEVGLSCIGFKPPLNKKQVLLRGPYRRLPVKARIVDADGTIQTGQDLLTAPVVRIVKLPASDPGYELGSFRIKKNEVWRAVVSAQDFPEKGRYLLFMDTGDSSEYLLDQTCSVIVNRR